MEYIGKLYGKIGNRYFDTGYTSEDFDNTVNKASDKEIEDYVWEEITIPLCQIDIDNQTNEYIQYLNAVYWMKLGRDFNKNK